MLRDVIYMYKVFGKPINLNWKRNFIALDGNETSVAITENIAHAYSNINVQVIFVMWTQSVK